MGGGFRFFLFFFFFGDRNTDAMQSVHTKVNPARRRWSGMNAEDRTSVDNLQPILSTLFDHHRTAATNKRRTPFAAFRPSTAHVQGAPTCPQDFCSPASSREHQTNAGSECRFRGYGTSDPPVWRSVPTNGRGFFPLMGSVSGLSWQPEARGNRFNARHLLEPLVPGALINPDRDGTRGGDGVDPVCKGRFSTSS